MEYIFIPTHTHTKKDIDLGADIKHSLAQCPSHRISYLDEELYGEVASYNRPIVLLDSSR